MNKSPLISIAMTCYNQVCYVEGAIKSIVDQAYTNWELVIVNDCSTDKSLKIINKCIEKYNIKGKVKIINNEKNMGYGYSLGKAISSSAGELVAIVDSDDALAHRKALKWSVKAHLEHPEVALTYSNYMECNKHLKIKKIYKTKQIPEDRMYLGTKIRVSHLKVIKKKYYDMTGGINPKLKQSVDKDLVLRMEEVGKLLYIDADLYYYRHHSENLTRSFNKRDAKYQEFVAKMRKQIHKDAKKRRQIKNKK